MDQQSNPIIPSEQPSVQPQKPLSKTWKIAAIVVAGILIISGIAYGTYYFGFKQFKFCTQEARQCSDGSYVGRTGPNCEFAQCPADFTADWQVHTSVAMGFTFKYPKEYSAPQERENYLSLISPLNPNRAPKMLELQDGELKIEIVTEAGQENDSTLKCWNDHASESGRTLEQSEILVSGIKTTVLTWEGLGTGQFICFSHNGKRYLINKYPAETTRQSEYNNIISTFKFIDPTVDASATALATGDWQTYKNEQYGFEVKYPEGWSAKEMASYPFGIILKSELLQEEASINIEPVNVGRESVFDLGAKPACDIRPIILADKVAKECVSELEFVYLKNIKISQLEGSKWENSNEISCEVKGGRKDLISLCGQILSTFKFLK